MNRFHNPSKLGPKFYGPYKLLNVYSNNSVKFKKTNEHVAIINIRHIVPFKGGEECRSSTSEVRNY